MSQHVCQCYVCHPEAFPPVPEEGSRYVGITATRRPDNTPRRVPDWASSLDGQPAWQARIEFNGEPAWGVRGPGVTGPRSWCITEAYENVVGWVVRTVGPPDGVSQHHYACACGSQAPCQVVEYGRVRIQMGQPSEVTP